MSFSFFMVWDVVLSPLDNVNHFPLLSFVKLKSSSP